jgi:hypothetical protein
MLISPVKGGPGTVGSASWKRLGKQRAGLDRRRHKQGKNPAWRA